MRKVMYANKSLLAVDHVAKGLQFRIRKSGEKVYVPTRFSPLFPHTRFAASPLSPCFLPRAGVFDPAQRLSESNRLSG